MDQNIGGFHTRDTLSISDRLSVGCINWYQTSTRRGLFASLDSGLVHSRVNRLYKRKETWQYKFVSVKAIYKKGEGLTSS